MFERIKKYRDRKFNEGTYLVYSMGKVGSSSVESSLVNRLPHAVIFHTHFLSDNWLNEILPKEKTFFHGNITIGKKIRTYLDQNKGKKIRIITLVREPIGREISGLFENWKAHFDNIENLSPDQFIGKLNKSNYNFCLNWLDTEFKEFTGVDLYELPFDQEKGYSIYQVKNFEILCIQLEVLDQKFSKAMKDYIGLNIQLKSSNIGNDKLGAELYKEVKSTYKLPLEKESIIFDSKYLNHFYSHKDILSMKSRWCRNIESEKTNL